MAGSIKTTPYGQNASHLTTYGPVCRLARPGRGPHGAWGMPGLRARVPVTRRNSTVEALESDVQYTIKHASMPAPAPARFTEGGQSFYAEHRVRGYEAGPDQRATVVTIANLLQEVAGNHAVGLWGRTDSGFANLPSMKDLIFVMTRLQLRMECYPRWGDIVGVETYFALDGRLAARRDWVLTNKTTGQYLGAATSTWVTINMATRRLGRMPEPLRKGYQSFSPGEGRHALPVESTKVKLPDMVYPPKIEGPVQVARRSDVDMNGHINNVTYLAWTLETVPEDVYATRQLYEFEIDFKAECVSGNTVESLANPLCDITNGNGTKQQFLHSLRRCDESGCVELVRARTTWAKKTGC